MYSNSGGGKPPDINGFLSRLFGGDDEPKKPATYQDELQEAVYERKQRLLAEHQQLQNALSLVAKGIISIEDMAYMKIQVGSLKEADDILKGLAGIRQAIEFVLGNILGYPEGKLPASYYTLYQSPYTESPLTMNIENILKLAEEYDQVQEREPEEGTSESL